MEYYNLEYLNKVDIGSVNNNDDGYKKYIVKKIIKNNAKNTSGWLIPEKLLPVKRGENKNKLIEANIIKRKKIVVKISKYKELLEKDLLISNNLKELNCINFANYLGFFSCKDNINNYNKNKPLPKYFCKNNGTNNYFLFMEYYPNGSLETYIPNNINEIISILNQIICSMILAYEKLEFVHGDLHPGNILIKKINRKTIKYNFEEGITEIETSNIIPVLFDFDRSYFSKFFGSLIIEIVTFVNLYEKLLLEKDILKFNSLTPFSYLKTELNKATNLSILKKIIGN
jgi:serine/threonine protein kinase